MKFNQNQLAVMVDMVKNAADFWIPMAALGHVQVSSFFVGIMGVVSSLLATLPLADPQYKL